MSKQGIKALSISAACLIWDKGTGEMLLVHTEEGMSQKLKRSTLPFEQTLNFFLSLIEVCCCWTHLSQTRRDTCMESLAR